MKCGTEERLKGLRDILPWLSNLHVFHWTSDGRRPLAEGASGWREYFKIIKSTGREHFASLEFVADNDPENFRRDAATLKQL